MVSQLYKCWSLIISFFAIHNFSNSCLVYFDSRQYRLRHRQNQWNHHQRLQNQMMISRIIRTIASMTTAIRAKRSGTSLREKARIPAGPRRGRICVTSCFFEMGTILMPVTQPEMRWRTAWRNTPIQMVCSWRPSSFENNRSLLFQAGIGNMCVWDPHSVGKYRILNLSFKATGYFCILTHEKQLFFLFQEGGTQLKSNIQ